MRLKKTKTKGKFKSPLENSVFKLLKKIVPYKTKIQYETEKLDYTILKNYIPDFILTLRDGRKVYVEVKGYFRQPDRTKMLAVLKDNPGVDLRIVFEKNNKLNKKARMRYSDWCEKHNIPYSINSIPMEWFK